MLRVRVTAVLLTLAAVALGNGHWIDKAENHFLRGL